MEAKEEDRLPESEVLGQMKCVFVTDLIMP
jgi:hypothetical protein